MKSVTSISLAIVLLLSMTACTGGSSNLPTTLHTSEPTSVTTEEVTTTAATAPTTVTTRATEESATVATKAPTTAATTQATSVPGTVATKAPTISTTAPMAVTTKATAPAVTKCVHSNADWVIDKAATCIAEGKKQKVCADCKTVLETAVIEKTGHSYTDYKCSVCGLLQEDGLSAYLSDWVQKNGKVSGETVSLDFYIDDILYGFTYNASGNYFYFSLLDESYNDFLSMKFTETAGVYDLAYIQGNEPNTREIYGKIDALKFTENTPITVEEYLGSSDGRPGAAENCRICTGLLLEAIETAFLQYDVGLTLRDLGFEEFK